MGVTFNIRLNMAAFRRDRPWCSKICRAFRCQRFFLYLCKHMYTRCLCELCYVVFAKLAHLTSKQTRQSSRPIKFHERLISIRQTVCILLGCFPRFPFYAFLQPPLRVAVKIRFSSGALKKVLIKLTYVITCVLTAASVYLRKHLQIKLVLSPNDSP